MNIQYYMIHCDEHHERKEVLDKTSQILGQPIKLFKGYYTKNNSVNLDEQIKYLQSIDFKLHFLNGYQFELPGEIGCYVSHHMLIKHINNTNQLNDDVSVIFEDDVDIPATLHNDIINIINILNNHKWHFVFLGSLLDHRHTHIANNIYYIDTNTYCWGTHAMLINNKYSDDIYEAHCKIQLQIDSHYTILSHQKTLNGYTIYPSICFQNLKSTIR